MGIIKEEIEIIKQKDPAIKSSIEVILYSSFWAILFHRIAHRFYKHKMYFVARFISQFSRWLTGIEIHPGAKIGKGLFIDHGMGVVIGETCEIGDNVTIYQGVTLGGTGKDMGKRHPTIGNNVLIGSGAKVLGPFKVGDNARIGAGSVVLKEVLPYTTVVGVPAKEASKEKNNMSNPSNTLDQNVLDPVQTECNELLEMIADLQKRVSQLENKEENK